MLTPAQLHLLRQQIDALRRINFRLRALRRMQRGDHLSGGGRSSGEHQHQRQQRLQQQHAVPGSAVLRIHSRGQVQGRGQQRPTKRRK